MYKKKYMKYKNKYLDLKFNMKGGLLLQYPESTVNIPDGSKYRILLVPEQSVEAEKNNYNIDYQSFIFCGSSACVYNIGNDKVLKLTSFTNEFRIQTEIDNIKYLQYLINNSNRHEGKIFINNIYEIGNYYLQKYTTEINNYTNIPDNYYNLMDKDIVVVINKYEIACYNDKQEKMESCIQSTNKGAYTIVESCNGGELFDNLKEYKNLQDIKLVMKNILLGLSFLHQNNLIHNDIKSQNIVLKEKNSLHDIRIIDFGLSIITKERFDQVNFKKGTLQYMSPQKLLITIFNISDILYTQKCDLYSMGIILLELLLKEEAMMQLIKFQEKIIKSCNNNPQEGLKNVRSHLDFDNFSTILENGIKEGIKLNEETISFLIGLLQYEESDRFSVEQALMHPWLNNQTESADLEYVPLEFLSATTNAEPIALEETNLDTNKKREGKKSTLDYTLDSPKRANTKKDTK